MSRLATTTALLGTLALLSALPVTGCDRRTAAEIGPPGEPGAMTWDGRERSFVLFTPSAATGDAKLHPLVVALHGGGGTADSMQEFSAFNRVGEREGFFVVYPQGVDKQWNDGRSDPISTAHSESVDDEGFLLALVDRLAAEHPVDPGRVFVTGISNGGTMSYRLACEHPERFAGYGPVASQPPVEIVGECTPDVATPLIIVNGTDDPVMPYDGGQIVVFGKERGRVLSTDETVAFFRSVNQCMPQVTSTQTVDDERRDETAVVFERYETGCEQAPVHLVRVEGGGHTWPGGTQYLGTWLIGEVSQEIAAEEVLWDFFASLPSR